MALLEFVAARLGRVVQSPGGEGGQCVDLVELWAASLGAAHIWGDAVALWANADAGQWLKVPNGPTNAPPAGAIVVWHPNASVGIGPAGHTAIALLADEHWLLSADQNWPQYSPVRFVLHTYAGVTGWLVRK